MRSQADAKGQSWQVPSHIMWQACQAVLSDLANGEILPGPGTLPITTSAMVQCRKKGPYHASHMLFANQKCGTPGFIKGTAQTIVCPLCAITENKIKSPILPNLQKLHREHGKEADDPFPMT